MPQRYDKKHWMKIGSSLTQPLTFLKGYIMYRLFALAIIVAAFSVYSALAQEYRQFTGSNNKIIEAAFLGFDEATQIVKLRLKDGREQNVKLDLFSAESQQWIKAGGKAVDADNPFGDDAPQQVYQSSFPDIFEAAIKGTAQDVKYLVSQGANVNVRNNGGMTPLHCAIAWHPNPMEIVKYLISQGADANATNKFGWTPLHEAAGREHGRNDTSDPGLEIMKLLVAHGVDVKARTNADAPPATNPNMTPLDMARSHRGSPARARYLSNSEWGESDFEWLFDGRSLNGWEGDTNAWRADQYENLLYNTGKGNLFTTKQYDNFILQLNFRCDDGANNGLLLRVDDNAKRDVSRAMKIPIADDKDITDQNHNGSVYDALSGPKTHTFRRAHPHAKGWNFMEVIADGQKITTYINGVKVVDGTLPRGKPFSNVRSGCIGLLGLDGTTTFKNIRIKPLKPGEDGRTSKITANDSKEGFVPIFDGKTLNGWRGDQNKFRVENNMLINFDTPGTLETIKEYRNFVMRFEFRLSRETENGVYIWKSAGDNGREIKIFADSNYKGGHNPWEIHGATHGVTARHGSLNPIGQWNTQEIIANGSQIQVVVNDQIVVDTDISHVPPRDVSGHIMFNGKRGQVEFRNIRIKELP